MFYLCASQHSLVDYPQKLTEVTKWCSVITKYHQSRAMTEKHTRTSNALLPFLVLQKAPREFSIDAVGIVNNLVGPKILPFLVIKYKLPKSIYFGNMNFAHFYLHKFSIAVRNILLTFASNLNIKCF